MTNTKHGTPIVSATLDMFDATTLNGIALDLLNAAVRHIESKRTASTGDRRYYDRRFEAAMAAYQALSTAIDSHTFEDPETMCDVCGSTSCANECYA